MCFSNISHDRSGVHPAIRIISFLVFAAGIIYSGWPQLLVGMLLLLMSFLGFSTVQWAPAIRMVARLRWLLLSIVVIYLFFTPGVPLGGSTSSWMPSVEGVDAGLHRLLCLIGLVLGVSLLLQTTGRESLIGGMLWLAAPLRRWGWDTSRLALRMVLTMEAVTVMQASQAPRSEQPQGLTQRVAYLASQLVSRFVQVTEQAEREPAREVVIPVLLAPAWYQWLVPLALLGGFYLL
ncbi:MAG: CbiQ family ECF transporter T component [Pseudomonadota bacterium]